MKAVFPIKKMQRLLILILISVLASIEANALYVGMEISANNIKYRITYIDDRNDSNNEVEVVSLTRPGIENLEIPSEILVLIDPYRYLYQRFNVTSIHNLTVIYDEILYDPMDGSSWIGTNFEDPESVKSMTIPQTVKSINANIFNKMPNLWEIQLDSNNQDFTLIDGVLYNKEADKLLYCPRGVNRCKIPETLKYIPDNAFANCENLDSIIIPSTITSIGDNAFANCESLNSINIPQTVTSIGKGVFRGCTKLEVIKVEPGNINYVGIEGILYNRNLSEILAIPLASVTEYTVPITVKEIPDSAFYGCESLTSIRLHDGMANINPYAFGKCSSLINVSIPSSIISIGKYAFRDCNSLTSLNIPNSVTDIGQGAFYGCSALTDVVIPSSITSVADETFMECSSLTSIVLPKTLTSIGNYAFRKCISIMHIDIPSCVSYLGRYVFEGCSSLTHVNIPNFTVISSGIFSNCTSLSNIVIPESVTNIGPDAFYNCVLLSTVTIPKLVSNIGYRAFGNCESLTSIIIPKSVKTIEARAFSDCSSLTSVTIGNGVEEIYTEAFKNCTNLLTIISMNPIPPNAYESSFENVPITADVYVPNEYTQNYMKAPGWSRFYNYHEVDEWEAGISDITADEQDTPLDVYTPQGICVKQGATKADIDALSKGLYIVSGKKVYIK